MRQTKPRKELLSHSPSDGWSTGGQQAVSPPAVSIDVKVGEDCIYLCTRVSAAYAATLSVSDSQDTMKSGKLTALSRKHINSVWIWHHLSYQ